jgi:hypothetical protein
MRKIRLFPFMLLIATGPVSAAPFLISSPYPTDVATQVVPTEFVVSISGLTPITTPAVPAGSNQVRLRLDLGPLELSGAKTATAKARNAWGESANSAPFSFTAGAPAVPTGIGLSSN